MATPFFLLHHSLRQHGIRYFDKAANVCSFYIVNVVALLAIFLTGVVNVVHNKVEPFVYLLFGPIVPHAVLRHLQSGYGYPSCVYSLAGSIVNFIVEEIVNGACRTSHVGNFPYQQAAIGHQHFCIVFVQFVFGRTGQRNVDFLFPGFGIREEMASELFGIRCDNVVVGSAKIEQGINLASRNPGRVINIAIRTGDG